MLGNGEPRVILHSSSNIEKKNGTREHLTFHGLDSCARRSLWRKPMPCCGSPARLRGQRSLGLGPFLRISIAWVLEQYTKRQHSPNRFGFRISAELLYMEAATCSGCNTFADFARGPPSGYSSTGRARIGLDSNGNAARRR